MSSTNHNQLEAMKHQHTFGHLVKTLLLLKVYEINTKKIEFYKEYEVTEQAQKTNKAEILEKYNPDPRT